MFIQFCFQFISFHLAFNCVKIPRLALFYFIFFSICLVYVLTLFNSELSIACSLVSYSHRLKKASEQCATLRSTYNIFLLLYTISFIIYIMSKNITLFYIGKKKQTNKYIPRISHKMFNKCFFYYYNYFSKFQQVFFLLHLCFGFVLFFFAKPCEYD